MIAFQLNKYSSDNQQRKTIATHLEQIAQETELNKSSLENAIKHSEGNISKLDTVISLINQRKDYDKINVLALELLNLGGVYIRKNAYQNVIETGDIRFMKDFEEKQHIIDLYEYYKWVEAFDEISNNLYMEDYYPYLKNNFDFVTGETQNEAVYQSKLFMNILGAYKRTSSNRVQKYKDCLKEIDIYLNSFKRKLTERLECFFLLNKIRIQTMENPNQISVRFREVLLNGRWVANTNYQHILSDVTWEQATQKVSSLNTIAALTFHINYYIAGVLNVFEGGTLDIRDKYSFDAPEIKSAEDWTNRLNKLLENAEKFAQHLEGMSDEKLEQPFVNEKYGNYRRNIDGMIEHCYYHLEQISLIKKMILEAN